MSRIARLSSRHQMKGAGLVDVARSLLARTYRTTTGMPIRVPSGTNTHHTASRGATQATRFASSYSEDAGRKEPERRSIEIASHRMVQLSGNERGLSDFDVINVRGKILSNTAISRQHLAPEIALHLISSDCAIYHRPIGAGESGADAVTFPTDPFWGFFWPGGQALTRYILDTEHFFRGYSVLDVGCGCGASSIAAKLVGASSVTANDIDPVALQATLLNAMVNGIMSHIDELQVSGDNLIGTPTTHHDIVLIGDLFYDTDIAADLHQWLERMASAGKKIFVGDPGRHGITDTGVLSHMILKARYELPEHVCLENNGFSHASVWQYC